MSDFEEGFVVGLLLGRKQGGGYRSDIFHDILENSGSWLELPIDDKFKYTASIWCSDRLEPYNNGYDQLYRTKDDDGICCVTLPPWNRKNVYAAITAWEDESPLYSKLYPIDSYTLNQHVSSVLVRNRDTGNNRSYYYVSEEYICSTENISFNDTALEFYYEYRTEFPYGIIIPACTMNYTKKVYEAVREDDHDIPEIIFRGEQAVTNTISRGMIPLVPDHNGTFSDLPMGRVFEKYSETITAIYTADGKEFLNVRLSQ